MDTVPGNPQKKYNDTLVTIHNRYHAAIAEHTNLEKQTKTIFFGYSFNLFAIKANTFILMANRFEDMHLAL